MSLRQAVGKVLVGSVSALFFGITAISALIALTSESAPTAHWFCVGSISFFCIAIGLAICAATEFNDSEEE